MSEIAMKIISENDFIKNVVDEFSVALDKDHIALRNFIEKLSTEERVQIANWIEESNFEKFLSEPSTIIPISKNLMLRNLPEDEFYEKLFKFINFIRINNFEDAKVAAVEIMSSVFFPYHQRELLNMDDEEYSEIVNELVEECDELVQILKLNYQQLTQISSAVLSVIDRVKDTNKRIVLMSRWISMFRDYTLSTATNFDK